MLAAVATIGQFSTSIYVPSIPAIAADLNAPVELLQLTIAAYLVPVAVGQLIGGALADRIGRRVVLFVGLTVFLAGTVVCATAGEVASLFLGRILQGLGAAAGLVVSRAVARDLYDGPALVRAVSVIALSFALVPGIAPLFGGAVQDLFGWRATFELTLVLGGLALLGYLKAVPETLPAGSPASWRELARGYGAIISDKRFQRNALVSAGPVAGIFAFLAGGPVFVVAEQGVPASVFGLYPPLATTGFLIFNRLAAGRLSVLGSERLVCIGCTLCLVGATFAATLRAVGSLEVIGLTFCMWLFSGGMGVVIPLATAAAMQLYPERAGSASAMIGFEQMMGGIAGAAGVAALTPLIGSLAFPVVMAAAAVVALTALAVLRCGGEGYASPGAGTGAGPAE
jgi:DHA1 family bicyclomycin/chloramphenicol resistance-like MFS transporter